MRRRTDRRNAGFTLLEMLLVVAVMVILVSISVAGLASYQDGLRQTRLDDAARAVYMAAQNQAELLRARGRLEGLAAEGENVLSTAEGELAYCLNSQEQMQELLPAGIMDESLRGGWFCVVYEPKSGSVTDVFYADEEPTVFASPSGFYEKFRSADQRILREFSLGHYGGEPAAAGQTVALRTPVIDVYNDGALRVEITYWAPERLRQDGGSLRLDAVLYYGGERTEQDHLCRLALEELPAERIRYREDGGVTSAAYLLDSPADGLPFASLGLWDSAGKTAWEALDGDFAVTARLRYEGGSGALAVPETESRYDTGSLLDGQSP